MMGIADAGSIIEPWLAAVIFAVFGGVLLAFAALWAACWIREEWRREDRGGKRRAKRAAEQARIDAGRQR